MTVVALLGTGLMGAPMAANLARADMEVRVWNRTRTKAEDLATSEPHLTAVATPAEAVADADVVITMLYDAQAVGEAMTGSTGAFESMSTSALWVQMSTVGVEGEAQLAELARLNGTTYIDAPVLGTRAPAEAGTLIVLASGPDEARQRCEEVLAPVSRRVLWLGQAGAGSRLKMVVNGWVLAITAAMGEAVALAEGFGIDPRVFLNLIEGHPTDSPYARAKAEAMLAREFPVSFPVQGALKDSRLVEAAMSIAGVHGLVSQAVVAQFATADQMGHGLEDMAAVFFAARSEGGGSA